MLLAKLGLDSHTIGVTVIAHALRDAGMEVIYSGLKQTPEMVVTTAIQEDVDVVGLSSLSAAHMQHLPRVVGAAARARRRRQARDRGRRDPRRGRAGSRGGGRRSKIFTMGATTDEIVAYIRAWWAARP